MMLHYLDYFLAKYEFLLAFVFFCPTIREIGERYLYYGASFCGVAHIWCPEGHVEQLLRLFC